MIFMKQMSFIFFLFATVTVIAANIPKISKKITYEILMEKTDLENPIVGWGLSPNGQYFVYSELKEIYYLDLISKKTYRIGSFDVLNGKTQFKFAESSSSFVLNNAERIMVYNLEAQEVQFDTTVENTIEAYLSGDGKNLVYVAASSVARGPSASANIYFYDLIHKKLNRTIGTTGGSDRTVIPCQLGTCLAFREYRFLLGALDGVGGHAQVISMDGRTAWENPFLQMQVSEITADHRSQISVRAFEKEHQFLAKDIRFDHYTVVDLMTQQRIYQSKQPSGDLGFYFHEIRSLGDELFLGITPRSIKLLRSHGEVMDETPMDSVLSLKQSKDRQYIMEYDGNGTQKPISVIKIDKVNGKLRHIAQVFSSETAQSLEFTSDSNFLLARFFQQGDVILTALETGEQLKLSTKSKVMNSKVLNQRPMALVLEENGTFGVIHFSKNQFQYQALYHVPFKIADQKWWQWEKEIFSSRNEKIQVLWNSNGFSILKINDPIE